MNNGDGQIELMEGGNQETFPGDKYISRRSSAKVKKEKKEKKKKKKEQRQSKGADVLSSAPEESLAYAESKYVKHPEPAPEEQANLLSDSSTMLDFDQDDLLATGGMSDEFEDELTEMEMREEKRRNLDAFGRTAAPRRNLCRLFKRYFVPMCIGLLFCFGIAATILYVVGYGKGASTNSTGNKKIAQIVPVAPSSLALTCANNNGGTDEDAFEVPKLCASECEKAECCWNPGGAYVCTDDTKQRCTDYQQPCAELARLDSTFITVDGFKEMVVAPMAPSLRDSCDSATFTVPSAACREGCLKGECCWKETTTFLCTEDTEEFCPDYENTCGFLNGHAEPKVPPASPDLGVYCNPNDVQETVCTDLCDKARCCWDHSVDSCVEEYGTECREYTLSCGVLNHDDDGGPPFPAAPDDMGSICDPSNSNMEKCRDACSQARCCWDSDVNSCEEDYDQDCHDYSETCGVLKDKGIAPFPAAPQDLGERCDPYTMDGAGCLDDCAKARCCWDDSVDLCVEEFGQDCSDYTLSCAFLNYRDASGNIVTPPPAPEGLASSCNPSNPDQDSCRAGCNQGRCCWDSNVASCVQEEGTACHDYTLACSHFNNAGSSGSSQSAPFPSAPDGLGADCNPSEMEEVSLQICQEKCDQAPCCWDRDATSCVHQYAIECHDYSLACGILNDLNTAPGNDNDITASSAQGSDVTEVPVAPSDLAQKCSFESINTSDGGKTLVECEQDCLQASCCWQPNVEPCIENPLCQPYQEPCQMFKTLFGAYTAAPTPKEKPVLPNVPVASSNINLFCKKDVLSPDVSNGDFIVKCEEECLKAACCWKDDDPFTCPDAPQCDDYMQPCKDNLIEALDNLSLDGGSGSSGGGGDATVITQPASGEPLPAPADLNLACSVQDLETNVAAVGLCENYCEPGSCCWTDDPAESCYDRYPSTCVHYEPCSIAFAQLASGGSAPTTSPAGSGSSSSIPAPPSNLNVICSQSAIEDMKMLQICKQTCLKADCCWLDSNDSDSCSSDSACSTYRDECALMREELQIDNGGISDAIASYCDESASDYEAEKCDTVCEPGECCLNEECPVYFDCTPYEVCENLLRRDMLRKR